MLTCPKCETNNVHRSRARGCWESWRRLLTRRRPFRCHNCDWRGWVPDTGVEPAAGHLAWSTARLSEDGAPHRLPELDLDALDATTGIAKEPKKPDDPLFVL